MSRAFDAYPLGWKIYALVLLAIGLLGCWAFVYRYVRTYKWWNNEFGRHLIAFSSCLGAFLTFYAVMAVWPELPGRGAIRLVLFTALVAVIVWRLVLFERIKRAEDRVRRDPSSPRSSGGNTPEEDR